MRVVGLVCRCHVCTFRGGMLVSLAFPLCVHDTVSERLRRWTRNPLGSARRGSNPLGVVPCVGATRRFTDILIMDMCMKHAVFHPKRQPGHLKGKPSEPQIIKYLDKYLYVKSKSKKRTNLLYPRECISTPQARCRHVVRRT